MAVNQDALKFPFEINEDELDLSITPILKDYPPECLPEPGLRRKIFRLNKLTPTYMNLQLGLLHLKFTERN